jgi:hypothetical protein
VFPAFAAPPGAEVRLSSLWYTYGFHIRGEFADGRPLPGARAFQEKAARIVDIVVRDATASIHFTE